MTYPSSPCIGGECVDLCAHLLNPSEGRDCGIQESSSLTCDLNAMRSGHFPSLNMDNIVSENASECIVAEL